MWGVQLVWSSSIHELTFCALRPASKGGVHSS